ncbi:DUF1629 domain-containing protein [Myxococcus faecalis]|jgi:hypothetical protein|uniref:imm11 family protein n=1 Tax=Myxococcus TaxID=32 RepID=UPI001CC01FA3|nr:DUF1629 domain-containing protein [Myxococcus sp. XM-1-1-1]MBZ4410540.1 hypothetical protein [Myxococcus sp. XM-1-1-1]
MANRVRYFSLNEDVKGGSWYLGDPLDDAGHELEDIWEFTEGRPVRSTGHLKFPIRESGRRLDYSAAGVAMTPVLHIRVATLFAELAPDDVQLLPADITDCPEQYVVLVATKLIRCIDDEASEEILRWKPEDGRPERVGQYRSVAGLRIDPAKVGDAKVFRTWGWKGALIVSEDIKTAVERANATGAQFEEV